MAAAERRRSSRMGDLTNEDDDTEPPRVFLHCDEHGAEEFFLSDLMCIKCEEEAHGFFTKNVALMGNIDEDTSKQNQISDKKTARASRRSTFNLPKKGGGSGNSSPSPTRRKSAFDGY